MKDTKEKETTPQVPPPVIKRSVKHTFTEPERSALSTELINALAMKSTTEADFDSVKASYKAKVSEAESRVESIAAALRCGFEMRPKDCNVIFRTKDRKKDIICIETKEIVATEDMTADDLQMDLLAAESKFECREEIILFEAGDDRGVLAVGRLGKLWYGALRLKVGKNALQERLDSEQKAAKRRADAIVSTAKRASEWLKANLKELSKGFEQPLAKALEAQLEREE